jgi:hypothetical protein
MTFRAVLISSLLLPASAAFAATGDECDPEAFAPRCNEDGSFQVCDGREETPVEASLSCTDQLGPAAEDASCAELGCVGACDNVPPSCLADVGEKCVGFTVFFNEDENDDGDAGSVLCAGDATCSVVVENNAPVDRCVAHLGDACTTTGGAACAGNIYNVCFADEAGTIGLTSNIAVDCTLLGTTCGRQNCECDAQCGEGGSCDGGFCDTGVTCVVELDQLPACPANGGGGDDDGDSPNADDSEDVGSDDDDNNRDDEAEAGPSRTINCNLNSFGAAMPTFGTLAIALLALRRRRR